jgi:hypothetical protein
MLVQKEKLRWEEKDDEGHKKYIWMEEFNTANNV